MNWKQIPQLKKPPDSQEDNYSSLQGETGFTTQGVRPFGGKRTLFLKSSNDSAPSARKNNQTEPGTFLAQENLAGEGAGGSRPSYPAPAQHKKKRSQVSCCAFQPLGQPSPSQHQRSPGHPGALDVTLILAEKVAARVSPTAASATLRQVCSQAHTAHGGGEQWCTGFANRAGKLKCRQDYSVLS